MESDRIRGRFEGKGSGYDGGMEELIGGVAAEIACHLFKILLVVGLQADLQNAAGRDVCTSKTTRQAFQLRQRHQNQKGWQMRLAQPICFKIHQSAPGSAGGNGETFPPFTQHAERPPPRSTGAVVVGEAEDGERGLPILHVDRNHMASMDMYVCVHCQHSTLLDYSLEMGDLSTARD